MFNVDAFDPDDAALPHVTFPEMSISNTCPCNPNASGKSPTLPYSSVKFKFTFVSAPRSVSPSPESGLLPVLITSCVIVF